MFFDPMPLIECFNSATWSYPTAVAGLVSYRHIMLFNLPCMHSSIY